MENIYSNDINKQKPIINHIVNLIQITVNAIYNNYLFALRENGFQNILYELIRDAGFMATKETTRPIYYTIALVNDDNDEQYITKQMTDGCSNREDITLVVEKLIIELKTIKNITNKEIFQISRYMHQRRCYDEWGPDTCGLLINYNDEKLQIYYLFYDDNDNLSYTILLEKKLKFIDIIKKYKFIDNSQHNEHNEHNEHNYTQINDDTDADLNPKSSFDSTKPVLDTDKSNCGND